MAIAPEKDKPALWRTFTKERPAESVLNVSFRINGFGRDSRKERVLPRGVPKCGGKRPGFPAGCGRFENRPARTESVTTFRRRHCPAQPAWQVR